MKKIALITISLLCSIVILAQGVKGFVNKQLQTYPQLRLLDLYKSCFQDYMGAEHLVSDRQRVKAYLDDELNTTSIDDLMPWNYEPCGIDSNYYRVSIRTIKESVISEDLLLDAFIRSANSKKRPTVDSWRDRWHVIIGTIDKMQLELPYYQQDKAFIDSILSVGRYAISHSPEYREAYHPHYRIVERGIFERELKPLIEHKYLQNKNNDMDDKKQIEQLYKQMYQAMIAKDIATLNTILAEGSVLIHMPGTIIDENYSLMLLANQDLSLTDAVLLDQVQKGKAIGSEAVAMLRKRKLIEGRLPHIYVAKDIAQATGQKVEYSKHKGLADKKCEALLLDSLNDHKILSKQEIVRLLWDVLPDQLDDKQKNTKVYNILRKLRASGKIVNQTTGNKSVWSLAKI